MQTTQRFNPLAKPAPFNATREVLANAASVLHQLDAAVVTTRDGLLYMDGRQLPVDEADTIAIRKGFTCAEQLVRHLEAKATPTPAPALKKLSFGKIAKKEETKTSYPVFPDARGEAAEIAARIIERTADFEALKGALETDKAELKFLTTPFYFEANRGRAEVPSSISVQSPKGEVLVTFQNRYARLESETVLMPVLGERTGEFFRQAFEFKIDGDKLPQDRAQDLINELQELMNRYGALDALEVKDSIKPTPDFHAKRHTLLTPEQNLQVDAACPITATVKTKGRK